MDYITSLSLARYGAQKGNPLDPLSGAIAVAAIASAMAAESQRLLDLRLDELKEQQKNESEERAKRGEGSKFLPQLDPKQVARREMANGVGEWDMPGIDGMRSTIRREDATDGHSYSTTVQRERDGHFTEARDVVGGRKAQERYGRLAQLSRAPVDRGEAAASRYDAYIQKELARERERKLNALPRMQRPTALW